MYSNALAQEEITPRPNWTPPGYSHKPAIRRTGNSEWSPSDRAARRLATPGSPHSSYGGGMIRALRQRECCEAFGHTASHPPAGTCRPPSHHSMCTTGVLVM